MTEPTPILPDDIPALRAMVVSQDAELRACRLMIEKLQHQLAGHRRHRFGARSETADQLALGIEEREIATAIDTPAPAADPAEKSKPKRAPLPPELPRETGVSETLCI